VTKSSAAAQGLNTPASYLLAAGCLIVILAVLWAVCGTKRYPPDTAATAEGTRRQFWYIFLGTDDRVSTSKVQFALWTLALAWALLVIAFHVAVYPPGTLDPRYLLLLGLPAGAAVSAKAITMGQKANGTVSKNRIPYKKKKAADAVKETVSNDQGDLDLGDAQYFLFTLVALTVFFIAFFHAPVKLPVLPDTLVALTSASAAAYVAKKAASSTPAKITAVSPQKGPANAPVKIFGSGLGSASSGDGGAGDVTFGGLTATVQGTADGRTATLPDAFELTP